MINPFKYSKFYHYYLVYDMLPNKIKTVLDYGSGDGYFVGNLSKKAINIYGCDVDIEKIKKSRIKYKQANFSTLKIGRKLPFQNSKFDAVFMFHVLEHVDSEKKAINEINRVLKKNGKLYLASPYRGLFSWADMANIRYVFPKSHKWFMEFVLGKNEYNKRFVSKKEIGLFGDCSSNRTRHHHYTEDEVRKMMSNKFIIEKFYKFSIFHPFLLLFRNIWDYFFESQKNLVDRLLWWDNHIQAGDLSYNMLVVAKKI